MLVESPCYSAALDIFINKGAQIIPVSLDNHGVRSDLIDDICQSKNPVLLYTNPTFQNPTGTVMSKERRMELIELAELYKFFIIEDDSFGEIYFEGATVPLRLKILIQTVTYYI